MTIAESLIQEGIEVGKKEGIELGKKKGIELGKRKGIELGKKEGYLRGQSDKARNIARDLILKGVDVTIVAETTGLSSEEILKLLEENS